SGGAARREPGSGHLAARRAAGLSGLVRRRGGHPAVAGPAMSGAGRLNLLLAAAIVAAAAAAVMLGEAALSGAQYAAAFTDPTSAPAEVLWAVRAPRIVCALLVGAALGLAGAVLQGLLRNPLAEPGVLGVSAAAALGAATAIVLGGAATPGLVEMSAMAGAGVAGL